MRIVLYIVLLLALLGPTRANPATNPGDALVFITVSAKQGDEIVQIREGTGFLVGRDGWVITAAHVLDVKIPSQAELLIEGTLGSRHNRPERYILDRQPVAFGDLDIALLRFPTGIPREYPYLCADPSPALTIGRTFDGLGFPLGQDVAVRDGKINSLPNARGLVLGNAGWARGMSGGPVVSDGAVIGIISGGLEGASSFDYFLPMTLVGLSTNWAAVVNKNCVDEVPPPIVRRYPIDETNDSHDHTFATTIKSYTITRDADPEHIIVDAQLEKTSATRESDVNITIAADKKSVTLRFNLKAGPKVDRYRGWLHGFLVLTMQPQG